VAGKAVIIHSPEEAEHFVRQHGTNADREFRLFTTSAAVDGFLAQRHSLRSECLSCYITHDEVVEHIQVSEAFVITLMDALDEKISPDFNRKVGCRGMRFFQPLYSYYGFIRFNACLNFLIGLQRALARHDISELHYYEYAFREGFRSEMSIAKLISGVLPEKIERFPIGLPANDGVVAERGRSLFQAGFGLVSDFRRLAGICHPGFLGRLLHRCKTLLCLMAPASRRPAVFIHDPPGKLSFYQRALKRYNLFSEELVMRCSAAKSEEKKSIRLDIDMPRQDRFGIGRLILDDMEADWNGNNYIDALIAFSAAVRSHDIRLGVWGTPPVSGSRDLLHSLLFEYLLVSGIPVIGHQHGGPYIGDQKNYTVAFMDFSRCSHYVSYGFTKEDFKHAYPQAAEPCVELFRYGNASVKSGNRQPPVTKEAVDILFPITNTISLFDGGMKRDKPDFIMAKQVALLTHLESKTGYNIVVKPFKRSNSNNLCMFSYLKGCKNIRIADDLAFSEAMRIYDVKCVVIEHISSPLYESLGEDVEILVWAGKVAPLEDGALELLKKRVYFLETERDMLDHIDLFLKNELPKKRDSSYFDHYVRGCTDGRHREIRLAERLARSHIRRDDEAGSDRNGKQRTRHES